MNIKGLTNLFPRYSLCLEFTHKLDDCTFEYDSEYSYRGNTENFEVLMNPYNWLFDIELTDDCIRVLRIDKETRSMYLSILY